MKVRIILKSKDDVELGWFDAGGLEFGLPAKGDAISVHEDDPAHGCYWVSRLEWGFAGGSVETVKVIAKSSHNSIKDESGCCVPPEKP